MNSLSSHQLWRVLLAQLLVLHLLTPLLASLAFHVEPLEDEGIECVVDWRLKEQQA